MSDLRALLAERIDALPSVPGDLDAVRRDGRRIRARRRLTTAAAATAVVAVVGVGFAVVGAGGDGHRHARDRDQFASLGTLDFSHGARAYGDPGGFVSLGGRRIPADKMEWLDTDAVATSAGIVFYDHGRPMLLDEAGTFSALLKGAVEHQQGFHPTAKAEADAPVVAWAARPGHDGDVLLVVQDLATREVLASTRLDCGLCSDVVIDGIDGGVVFVRDRDGTRTWDSVTGKWQDFAGPDTRVADVRSGVVLYDGPAPFSPGDWHLVPGAVDAQLTLDGSHVLSWSSTLAPTTPGGEPIVLDQGPTGPLGDQQGFGWWTIDTDGSVLVATGKKYGDFTVYDCAVPPGACESLGDLTPTGGDPMFIGNDM